MSLKSGKVPSYTITSRILELTVQIGERIGQVEALGIDQNLRLRRINHIRSIQGSLAIEGNTLSEEQISTLLEGKPVVGPRREVQEARNAIEAYKVYKKWRPESGKDLLKAHEILMTDLLDAPGHYRQGEVAVGGGGMVHHVAPPAARVPALMTDLLKWIEDTDEHPLVVSSVFHYEFEFIHPFLDGNGRMGRLWQTLILTYWRALFAHVPVESLVYAHQQAYYKAIRESTKAGESTAFVQFMLEIILESLQRAQESDQVDDQVSDQVARLIAALRKGSKTATELMAEMGLSHRHAFRTRYIRPAIELGLVEMTRPESPTARNQKYRLTVRGREYENRGEEDGIAHF